MSRQENDWSTDGRLANRGPAALPASGKAEACLGGLGWRSERLEDAVGERRRLIAAIPGSQGGLNRQRNGFRELHISGAAAAAIGARATRTVTVVVVNDVSMTTLDA